MEELEIILEVEDNGEQNITISEENIELVYPMLEDLEVTPSKEEQNFKSKMYGYNNVKVKQVTSDVDENIKAENIRVGTTILDVEGSFNGVDTSDATATPDDILEGKTAYVDNTMISGVMKEYDGDYTGNTSTPVRQFSSIEEMQNSTVNNTGDLCVVYNEDYADLEVGKTYTDMYLPQTIELDSTITSSINIFFANSTNVDKTLHVRITPTSIVFYRPARVALIVYRAEAMDTVKYTSVDGKTYTRTDNLGDYLTISEIYGGYHTNITIQSGNYDILTQMFKAYSKTYGGSYRYTENDTWTALNDNILNVTPSKDEQIYTGEYAEVHIEGDEDLVSSNIKEGATIFGVPGTLAVGDVKITNASYLFYKNARLDNMNEILSLCDWDKITDCAYMFGSCGKLTELDVSNLNTSNVTDMSYMFEYCRNLTSLNVSGINTSKVTTMNDIFGYCENLTYLDLSNFDMSNVKSTTHLFNSCKKLSNLNIDVLNLDSSTNMSSIFNYCESLTSIAIQHTKGIVQSLTNLFSNAIALKTIDLSNFDASKVTSCSNMFGSNSALTDLKFMKDLGKGFKQKTENYSWYTLNLSYKMTNLTHDSLMSVINNLYDLNLTYDVANGGTLYRQSLVLGSAHLAKLTSDEIAIATNKGWNVT